MALCGDAAHVFPPCEYIKNQHHGCAKNNKGTVGGQGIASGFRDAVSLAWRLVLLCRRQSSTKPSNHEEVLSGWYIERKQQLERSLASTIENGKMVTESNPIKIFFRDWSLYSMHLFPSWRRDLRLGRRKGAMMKYQYSPGLPFDPAHVGGMCLPQIYCKPVGRSGEVLFSDDILFGKEKNGLFRLLVYLTEVDELPAARKTVGRVEDISKGEIIGAEAAYLIENFGIDSKTVIEDTSSVYCLASGEEFAGSPLCRGRPEPEYYDPFCLAKALEGNRFVLLRPDRVIFAACDDIFQLERVVLKAVAYLHG